MYSEPRLPPQVKGAVIRCAGCIAQSPELTRRRGGLQPAGSGSSRQAPPTRQASALSSSSFRCSCGVPSAAPRHCGLTLRRCRSSARGASKLPQYRCQKVAIGHPPSALHEAAALRRCNQCAVPRRRAIFKRFGCRRRLRTTWPNSTAACAPPRVVSLAAPCCTRA